MPRPEPDHRRPGCFPYAFASSASVPVGSVPGWLQSFAQRQPVGQVIEASRPLMPGGPSASWSTSDAWQGPAWSVGNLAVPVLIAVGMCRRTA